MIPDGAVEALARVLANESLFKADLDGAGWDAETDSSDHFMPNARIRAMVYLEAAAPHRPKYPHASGDCVVLGPETFTNGSADVICHKGQNYYLGDTK